MGALDALAAFEGSRRQGSILRPGARPRTTQQAHKEVRRAFGDTWRFVHSNSNVKELLARLEGEAARAFGSEGELAALSWLLRWDGEDFATQDGAPPAEEM